MQNIERTLRTAFGAVMTLLLVGCANRLFYYPDSAVYQTPRSDGLPFEEVAFASRDGTRLSGWFVPSVGKAKGTIVHFHGNAQNMTSHFSFVKWLPREGYNIFVLDYRGYGKSAGKPGRQGVFDDCLAALDCVRARPDIDREKIIVFGQSLGGANAIAVLGENTNAARGVCAIAIDSSFYSYRQIVRDKIRMIPVLSLLRWPLSFVAVSNGHSPGDAVANLPPVPKFFLHGKKDAVVPVAHGQRLFAEAGEPKELLLADDCNHTEAIMKSPAYRKALLDFFDRAVR
jgi:fermentation-respiration switch protein FrsA (DUF1100 family)